MTINGSCFCGDIRYKIEGELHNAVSCHCSMCRKMFSSQASTTAQFKPASFSWLTGKDQLTLYESKKKFGIQFCKKCGSTLGGTYKGELCWVTLGCVEGDPHVTLGKHIFVGSKATWETIAGDVPQYEAWPPKDA